MAPYLSHSSMNLSCFDRARKSCDFGLLNSSILAWFVKVSASKRHCLQIVFVGIIYTNTCACRSSSSHSAERLVGDLQPSLFLRKSQVDLPVLTLSRMRTQLPHSSIMPLKTSNRVLMTRQRPLNRSKLSWILILWSLKKKSVSGLMSSLC